MNVPTGGEKKRKKEERAKERTLHIATLHKLSESQKQLSNSKQKTVLQY